jgi:hypothetical protein
VDLQADILAQLLESTHPVLWLVRFFTIRRLHPPVAGPDVLSRAAGRYNRNDKVLLRT